MFLYLYKKMNILHCWKHRVQTRNKLGYQINDFCNILGYVISSEVPFFFICLYFHMFINNR